MHAQVEDLKQEIQRSQDAGGAPPTPPASNGARNALAEAKEEEGRALALQVLYPYVVTA